MTQYANGIERRKRILAFIERFIHEHKYPPSVREIQTGCDLRSPSTVHRHLNHLEGAGIIKRSNGLSRSIVLLPR